MTVQIRWWLDELHMDGALPQWRGKCTCGWRAPVWRASKDFAEKEMNDHKHQRPEMMLV